MKVIAGAMAMLISVSGCAFSQNKNAIMNNIAQESKMEAQRSSDFFYISVNGKTVNATFSDNDAVNELKEKLSQGDITIEAHDYGGFEKVGSLGFSLIRNDRQTKTECGDIMLYQGNQLTFFYESNSWSYTPIGHIDLSEKDLKEFFGEGDVSITLSLINALYEYKIADMILLQSHILNRKTEDLNGKPYDLNNDGVWNVSDLCIMRKKLTAYAPENNQPISSTSRTISSA